MSIQEAVERFLAAIRAEGKSPETVRWYRSTLAIFVRNVGDDWAKVETVREFLSGLATLCAGARPASTIATYEGRHPYPISVVVSHPRRLLFSALLIADPHRLSKPAGLCAAGGRWLAPSRAEM